MPELFSGYEINRTPRWPRLARLGAGSLALHALIVASVLYVPAIRDTLQLANVFAGADYLDEEYAKIAIRERAQVINLADGGFQYPEGYFNKQTVPAASAPPPQIVKVVAPRPKPVPKPTPRPTPAPTPAPEVVASNNGANPAEVKNEPTPTPGEATLNEVAEQAKIKRPPTINKKPFVDLLVKAKQEKDRGEFDLNGSIEMDLTGYRNEDGTLSNVEIVRFKGDPKLKSIVKEFVQALSASRALTFLEGAERLNLTLKLDEHTVAATAATKMETEERARQMANGYGLMLGTARFMKRGRDESVVLNNTTISSSGREVKVSFKLPRATAGQMLAKQLP